MDSVEEVTFAVVRDWECAQDSCPLVNLAEDCYHRWAASTHIRRQLSLTVIDDLHSPAVFQSAQHAA